MRLIFLIFPSEYWKLGFSSTPKRMFNEWAVELGNVSVSSKTTFSGILKAFVSTNLGCSDKIRFCKKPFIAYLTNKTLTLRKTHVILIFPVGYYWLVKLVRSFIEKPFAYLDLFFYLVILSLVQTQRFQWS